MPIAEYSVHIRNRTMWVQGLPSEVKPTSKDLLRVPVAPEEAEKVEDLVAADVNCIYGNT
jgi:hypothetical protein